MSTRVLHGNFFFKLYGTALCKKHVCEVSTILAKWFRREEIKNLLTHGCTGGRTDDERRTIGHHKSSP